MCRNVRSAFTPPGLGPLTLEAVQLPARRNSGVLWMPWIHPGALCRDLGRMSNRISVIIIVKTAFVLALGQEILSQAIFQYPPKKHCYDDLKGIQVNKT